MSTSTGTTTYELGETNFSSAEVFAWTDGEGALVGRLVRTGKGCQARLENGRWLSGTFATPAEGLKAFEKELGK